MKRILILTSLYTGHGHKSVSDALVERFEQYEDIEVRAVDGFELMNKVEQYMGERTYGPITRMPGRAWEWNYAAGRKLQKPVTRIISALIHAKLMELLTAFKPDVIISVHPMFNGSVLGVLEKEGLNIPLIAHEVDLVDMRPQRNLTIIPSHTEFRQRRSRKSAFLFAGVLSMPGQSPTTAQSSQS